MKVDGAVDRDPLGQHPTQKTLRAQQIVLFWGHVYLRAAGKAAHFFDGKFRFWPIPVTNQTARNGNSGKEKSRW
ncbi:MAG: hypothetical protein P8Y12_07320 [Gammaproteobacteria bacterium]